MLHVGFCTPHQACFLVWEHDSGMLWNLWQTTMCARIHTYSSYLLNMFSRMRSKGSCFTLGCGGRAVFAGRCVYVRNRSQPSATVRNRPQRFATVRNRPQPSATVRNRPCDGRMAVPIGSSAKGVPFGAFQLRVASFRVAGVALRGVPTCFRTRQKSFCVAGALLLPRFPKMHCIFRGKSSTLDTSDLILRGRRSTFDVSCCVLFANRIVSAARSGDKVKIPWKAWNFATGDENRRKPRTKRRFWGRFVRKLVGKRRFWSCKVWMLRKSRTKRSFCCSNMSRLKSLASMVPSQCLWGKLPNPSLLNVSKQAVMSFCVAGVALCDIPTCFMTCQKSFCVAGAILLPRFQKMCCIFHGRRSTLGTSDFILRGRRTTLDVACCVSFVNLIVSAAPSVDKVQIPWISVAGVAFCDMWWKTDGSHTLHFTLKLFHYTL